MVRTLVNLGGILAALQNMGEPAHVRNDFQPQASAFERFVGARFGTAGVPPAAAPVVRARLTDYFHAKDGQGMADVTHRGFFSAGTVPAGLNLPLGVTARDVRAAANRALPYPAPVLTSLALGDTKTRYVNLEGRRVLAYKRVPVVSTTTHPATSQTLGQGGVLSGR